MKTIRFVFSALLVSGFTAALFISAVRGANYSKPMDSVAYVYGAINSVTDLLRNAPIMTTKMQTVTTNSFSIQAGEQRSLL
jgi:hypothetical protein